MPYRRLNIPLTSTSTTAPKRPMPRVPIDTDNFDRADTTEGDLGQTAGGYTWQTDRFRISGGRAVIETGAPSNLYRAAINPGMTDVEIRAMFWPPSGGPGAGLAVRCGNVVNAPFYWLWGSGHQGTQTWRVRRRDNAGALVDVLDTGIPVREGPYDLRLAVKGTTIAATVDGQYFSTTDTNITGGTRVGVVAIPTNASGTTTAASTFDDFALYEP